MATLSSTSVGMSKVASAVFGRQSIRYAPQFFLTQNRFGDARDWRTYEARRSRQAIYWAHYENTIYSDVNTWIEQLKQDNALYEHIRPIYSPAHRLGEFWSTHVFGGPLDPEAGPGDKIPSAIPILTDDEELRKAIAMIWRASNWQTHKETLARFGGVMGDAITVIEDDPDKQSVRIRVIDPRTVAEIDKDSMDNVRGYVILEYRPDPRESSLDGGYVLSPYVEYKEICRRQGDAVVFETFLDGEPYDWNDPDRNGRRPRGPMWIEDYGFIPMVHVQHKDLGLCWGASEFYGLLSKLYELDDQASKLGDYVRKCVDAPWLFSGVSLDNVTDERNDTMERRGDTPHQGRQRIPSLYSTDPNAKATPLVAPLALDHVLQNIASIMRVIEQEHPELTADLALATGDASGKALRVAREKAEALVTQRRAVYDDGMRRIHQMAISVGAQKGYKGFEAFTADSFRAKKLDHAIGPRPIFAINERERIEEETARATLIETFFRSGMPLETAMDRAGYSGEQIAEMKKARDEEAAYKLRQIMLQQSTAATDGASYGHFSGGVKQ